MSTLKNLLKLASGDFFAKTLYFLAFIQLARSLGVEWYGTIEFAVSVLTYLLLLADAGLELWGTRSAAQGKDVRQLVAIIAPLRILMATLMFGLLLVTLPLFPDYPLLRTVISLFALTLFVEAASLKWAFMGVERMGRVATGLGIAQLTFASLVLLFVRNPAHIVWVPIFRIVGDLAMTLYFGRLFISSYGNVRLVFSLREARELTRPALTMGAARALALMSYNFDSVLLGFWLGPLAVGLYSAGYKPISVALALPVTFFIGLFPALSRSFSAGRESFHDLVTNSLRLSSVAAVPIGVGALFLANDVILFLFGERYRESAPVLAILAWSASLVILRGTYRQGFNAAGQQRWDLATAALGTGANVVLNIVLIPFFGILGAATATVLSEIVWLTSASHAFRRQVTAVRLLPLLTRPGMAALIMAAYFILAYRIPWPLRAALGAAIYLASILLLDRQVRRWPSVLRAAILGLDNRGQ